MRTTMIRASLFGVFGIATWVLAGQPAVAQGEPIWEYRAEVNEREITLELYAFNEAVLPEKVGAKGDMVRTPPDWLPG